MGFNSIKFMLETCEKQDKSLAQLIIEDDASQRGIPTEDTVNEMKRLWEAMKASVEGYDGRLKSNSGLSGGDGRKFMDYMAQNKTMSGDFVGKIICRSVSVAESNACMKRIVAAPTAGSCGVLPAVLTSYVDKYSVDETKIIDALFIAAGVGEVIAERASISGAECGCQAEIGSASSMAACALAYLQDGNNDVIMQAGTMALKNLLGLACDPVGGYVEVPCVKRNAIGAVNAVTAADMALAGITSVIPFDEVIDAMGDIGRRMDSGIRETGKGGLAITPTGLKYSAKPI